MDSSEIQIVDLLVGPFKDTELHRRLALFKSHGYNVKIFAKLYLSELISPALPATFGYVKQREERAAK